MQLYLILYVLKPEIRINCVSIIIFASQNLTAKTMLNIKLLSNVMWPRSTL